jgi:hypothetical protein
MGLCDQGEYSKLLESYRYNSRQRVDNVPENSEGGDSPLPKIGSSPELSELLEQYPCLAAELAQSDVGPQMCEEPDE